MSDINTELSRLQTAKADLKTAIEAKGVTVGGGTIDTYPALIEQISAGGVGSLPDIVPVVWGNQHIMNGFYNNGNYYQLCNSAMTIVCDRSDLLVSSDKLNAFYSDSIGGYNLFGVSSIFRNAFSFRRSFFDERTSIKFINGKSYGFTSMFTETPTLTVVKFDGSETTYTNRTILDLYEKNNHDSFVIPSMTDLVFENMDFTDIYILRIDTYGLSIND